MKTPELKPKRDGRVRSSELVRPLYPSRDYKEYCADQKRKGLMRRYWKDLPEMWKEELAFRRELEDALNERSNID